MNNLALFKDELLTILMPSYLKPKKGIRYFVADHRRAKNPEVEAIAIDVPIGHERACDLIDILSRTQTFDWGDVKYRTLVMGEVHEKGKGFEVLTHSFNSATNANVIVYNRLFCLTCNKIYAYATIYKNGKIDGFHDLCIQIIRSAKLIV